MKLDELARAQRNKVIFDRAIHALQEAYDFKERQDVLAWLCDDACLDWVNMELPALPVKPKSP